MIRRRVYYDGRVQGVGFRATTDQIAADHEVGGTVRNLDDGRVELIVEGQTEAVEAFLGGGPFPARPLYSGRACRTGTLGRTFFRFPRNRLSEGRRGRRSCAPAPADRTSSNPIFLDTTRAESRHP